MPRIEVTQEEQIIILTRRISEARTAGAKRALEIALQLVSAIPHQVKDKLSAESWREAIEDAARRIETTPPQSL